jgi:hypothetical protein
VHERIGRCGPGALPAGPEFVSAEDGYDLWLRYPVLDDPGRSALSGQLRAIAAPADP